MTLWVRFAPAPGSEAQFGQLEGDTVLVHTGDMFGANTPTGERLPLADIQLLAPTRPSKMIALWNNFHAMATKMGQAIPPEPLYFLKAASCFAGPGTQVRRPAGYDGKIIYEGELGIVIGRRAKRITESEAQAHIFGYTAINDITAVDLLHRDPTFTHWTRAKSFDGFGLMGPTIATGLDPATLTIRTTLNGTERQNYPVADMIFAPAKLIGLLSHDMTLEPGDVICCGTSLGVGTMKEPLNTIDITIDGIGTLNATYRND